MPSQTPAQSILCKVAPETCVLALLWTLNAAEVVCRHILSALYNVADRYDEDAIRSVLRELTPRSARIMWASKTHKVQRARSADVRLCCRQSES